MNFYDSWFYTSIINNKWVLWTIVVIIIAGNFLSPILFWLMVSGKLEKKKKKKGGQNKNN